MTSLTPPPLSSRLPVRSNHIVWKRKTSGHDRSTHTEKSSDGESFPHRQGLLRTEIDHHVFSDKGARMVLEYWNGHCSYRPPDPTAP